MKKSQTDILIVGAGPAGLMLACWLSRLGVDYRIVDKRSTKIYTGQADGIQVRTLEVLDGFTFHPSNDSIGQKIWRESFHMLEISFWNPSPEDNSKIARTSHLADTEPDLSRFTECVLHQGRIERFCLDAIKHYSGSDVERGLVPDQLELDLTRADDHSKDNFPIKINLRHLREDEAKPAQFSPTAPDGLYRSNLFEDDSADVHPKGAPDPGSLEEVDAKYVVGCDGARSWVRKQMGNAYELKGEAANVFWGVIDAVPVTDFPDIRKRCAIHSAELGSMMIIPRERQLVRLYIQLGALKVGERVDRSKISPEGILGTAKKIIHPYKLELFDMEWWTCYEIGQRLTERFSLQNRIFIAGDACHTHSPKAGQGMNVSLMDTYNLGWKLAHTVKGITKPDILSTYQTERHQVAKNLIEFDQKFSALFSGRPARDLADETGISIEEFQNVFAQGARFMAGLSVDYTPSLLISKESDTSTAQTSTSKLEIGKRLPSYKVVCFADSRPWELQQLMPSDGRWRILLFAGKLSPSCPKSNSPSPSFSRFQTFCQYLESSQGPVGKYTPGGKDWDSTIEVLAILANEREGFELGDFPELVRPRKGKNGFIDYWKVFCDCKSHHEGSDNIYEKYGISKDQGAAIMVRPDGYVALVTNLENKSKIGTFFDGFMISPKENISHRPPSFTTDGMLRALNEATSQFEVATEA